MSCYPGSCAPVNHHSAGWHRLLRCCAAFVLLIGGGAFAFAGDADSFAAGPLEIEEAVDLALAANPGLASVVEQANAAAAVAPQVGSLPDPVLSFNAQNLPVDTFNLDQEPMTQLQLGISQSVPFPGKLGLRKAAAEREAAAATSAVDERRQKLIGEVRATWWQLFFLDRALEIIRQNQSFMRDFIEITQTKYKVGSGLQQDVLLAQLELSRLLDRELRLKGQRTAVQATMNSLLDRPSYLAITMPEQPGNDRLPPLGDETVLLEQAVAARPLLAARREQVEASRKRVDLAQRDYYPDLRLGAAYGFRQTHDRITGQPLPDFLSLQLSINVPLYANSRQSKAIEQRSSELSQRKFLLNDALREVESSISRYYAGYVAARDQVLLFQTAIVPQAQQTVESMLAGYQVNRVDFLNVVNAQLRLYDAQINQWEALSDAKQALAKLAVAVGEESLYE